MNGFAKIAMAGLFLICSCSNEPARQPNTIKDLHVLPQETQAYLMQSDQHEPLIKPEVQAEMLEHLRKQFYRPWEQSHATPQQVDLAAIANAFAGGKFVQTNRQPFEPDTSALEKSFVPGTGFGITVRNTSLRELPTHEPAFESFDKAGGGYPFDMLQASALHTGMPVCVLGTLKDWMLVDSPFGMGFLPAEDVALTDENFRRQWQALPLGAPLIDNLAVTFLPPARGVAIVNLGALLPVESQGRDSSTRLLLPVRLPDGNAGIEKGIAPPPAPSSVPSATFCKLPLAATARNLATLGQQLIGQSYGWGGMQGLRDCSSTTHDLMVTMGIWLPRNSGDQAKAGKAIVLKGFSNKEKERLVLEHGRPWLTLLRSPGHIMLYVGQHGGRPVMLHNFWGVKTRRDGMEGRCIVGRCAITHLDPGVDLPDVLTTYLDTMESMILLDEAP